MNDPTSAFLDRVETQLRRAIDEGDTTAIDYLGEILDAAEERGRTHERGARPTPGTTD